MASNIKDRQNRHNVSRILSIIESHMNEIYQKNVKGLFIFCGIDISGKEHFILLGPHLNCRMFYYNCGCKFVTDIFDSYYDEYIGSIIFVDGCICLMYKFNNSIGKFEIFRSFESAIPKKHKKGGQSSARFGRISDNIRYNFITAIIDNVNKLDNNGNWIFGSNDITNDMKLRKNEIGVNLNYGGFIDFDKKTIKNTSTLLQFIKKIDDMNYEVFDKIIKYFEMAPEMLDFGDNIFVSPEKYEYIVVNPTHKLYIEHEKLNDKIIKLTPSNKYFGKLQGIAYIGVFYFPEQSKLYDDKV